MDNAPHPSASTHDWLAYLAHDFKVPLEHIRQIIPRLESLVFSDDIDRERLLQITRSLRRELAAAESLRSGILAHLDLDSTETRFASVRLDEVLQIVVNSLEMDADLKEIELDYRKPAVPLHVQGDATLLSRVFQNLILNAIENTPRLGFVGVEAEPVTDRVRVVVSDTGPGIPATQMRRLIDSAHQPGPQEVNRPDGRGLGLTFVRRVLDLHRGYIVAEPGSQQGSCLIVELSLNGISFLADQSAN